MTYAVLLLLVATPPAPAASPAAAPTEAVPAAAAPASDWPGPKSATATAEKTEVRLGEPFVITVEVRHARGEKWSLVPTQKLDPFKLRSQKELPTGDEELTRLSLELALFQLGSHAVPELTLLSQVPGQSPHEFRLPGPLITGVDALGKDRQKRDIRPPVAFRVRTLRPLAYLAGILAAIGAIWLAVWAWRRRPKRSLIQVAPRIPEDQLALKALSELEGEALPGNGKFKEYHLRLSEILRRYLGERYGIPAIDMTSEELHAGLSRLPSEGLSLADLQWVCTQGDLAKFAKAVPTVDDCKQAMQMVRQLIGRTRRHEREIDEALANAARKGVAA